MTREGTPTYTVPGRSTLVLLLLLSGSIFTCEMMIERFFPPDFALTGWLKAAADSAMLIVGVFPFLYYFAFRPLKLLAGSLQQSEQRFRGTFEKAAIGIAHLDTEGRFVHLNDRWCEIVGYRRPELLGKSFQLLTHPDDMLLSVTNFTSMLGNETREFSAEKRYVRKGGSVIWVNLTTTLIRDSKNSPHYFVSVIEDITARKRAEEALAESEQKHRSLFATMSQGVIYYTPGGRILTANPAAEQILGVPQGQLEGRTFFSDEWKLIQEDGSPMASGDHPLMVAMRTGKAVERFIAGVSNPHKQVTQWLSITAIPLFHPGEHKPFQIYSTFEDITERKEREKEIADAFLYTRTIVETSPVGIITYDAGGEAISANPAAAAIVGTTVELLLTQNFRTLESWKRSGMLDAAETAIASGTVQNIEVHHFSTFGKTLWMSARFLPFAHKGRTILLAIFFDVTERMQAEAELRESEANLNVILESTEDGILAVDDAGNVIRTNKRFAELWRIPQALIESKDDNALLGFVTDQLIDPMEFIAKVHELYGSAAEDRDSLHFKDGRIFGRYSAPIVLGGKITGRVWSFRDITERRRAESALRESEEKFRTLFEGSHDALMTLTPPLWMFTSCNASTIAMFNAANAEELITKGPSHLSPVRQPDGSLSSDTSMAMIGIAMQRGSHYFEWTHKRLNGEEFPATVLLTRLELEGKPFLQATVRDITERQRSENMLRESRERLRAIYEGTNVGLAFGDLAGNFLDINPAMERILGYSLQDLRIKTLKDITHPEDLPVDAILFGELLEGTRKHYQIEKRYYHKNGDTVWALAGVSLVRDESGRPQYAIGMIEDITERKRAEEEMRASEKQYRQLFDQMLSGLLVCELLSDEEGTPTGHRYLNANSAFEAMTGLSADAIIGKSDKEVDIGWPSEIARQCYEVALSGTPIEYQRFNARLGRFYETRVFSPRPGQFAHVFTDITARKRAAEALRESDERYRSLFDNAPVGVFHSTIGGRNISANTEFARMLGYGSSEEVGETADPLKVSESLLLRVDRWEQLLEKTAEAPGTWIHDEARVRRKDGAAITAKITIRAIPEHYGDVEGFIEDITERKAAETQLRKLSLAVEQSPASIVITDTKGYIEYVNPKFTHVTGYTPSEVIGKNPRFLKSGDKPVEEYAQLWNAITAGKEWRGEFHNRKKSGELFWEMASISPVKNKDNEVTNFVAVKEDITERRRAEDALRQAQKLESLGTLAGGIAHDFNNVLGGIMGYADMSLRFAEKDSTLERNLLKVLKATDRAKQLIQQILTFSRKASPHKSVIYLRPIVLEVMELLNASIPSSVMIELDLHRNTKPVLADPAKIHEALLNLATNAVHAMERKGTLTIRLHAQHVDRAVYGQAGEIAPGEYTMLEVSDTGCGMDAAVLSKAFEPFFTTKAVGEGTGMGLSVVLGIVQSAGGDIRVATELNKGSTFELYFPATEESASAPASDESLVELHGTERLLFVDDEQMLIDTARDLLTPLGYSVTGIGSSVEALEYVRGHANEIDALITDQTMPVMTGLELAKEVLEIKKEMPIILCTGFSNELNPERAAAVGIRHLLMKPFRFYEIAKLLREVFN